MESGSAENRAASCCTLSSSPSFWTSCMKLPTTCISLPCTPSSFVSAWIPSSERSLITVTSAPSKASAMGAPSVARRKDRPYSSSFDTAEASTAASMVPSAWDAPSTENARSAASSMDTS